MTDRRVVDLEERVDDLQKQVWALAEKVNGIPTSDAEKQREWDRWAKNEKRSSAGENP